MDFPGVRGFYLDSARRAGLRFVRWVSGPALPVLATVDVVVTHHSNLVIEAILMGCLVILVPPHGDRLGQLTSIHRVHRPQGLGEALRGAIHEVLPESVLAGDAGRLHVGGDGRSGGRIVELIERVIRQYRAPRRLNQGEMG
jgi:hypothetical protein